MAVAPTDDGLVCRVGLHGLGLFADRIGLTDALTTAVHTHRRGERAPAHERGKVLVHEALVLAGGGETCADVEQLRFEDDLFGEVASDTTTWRTFHEIGPGALAAIDETLAGVRRKVWARTTATDGSAPVVLDIDASLVEIHSENKEGTAPNYKGGFGFHPMFCFADATGETLAAVLRPGNAGANTVSDHLDLLDRSIGQLPVDIAVGHRRGDDPDLAGRGVHVRADTGGCTHGFVWGCRARNVTFAVVARKTGAIHDAIAKALCDQDRWEPAIRTTGKPSRRARVCEITDLLDTDALADMPPGTRLIVRQEQRHQGAQRSLFPSDEWRFWAHYTDQTGSTPADLDRHMRAHAHCENHLDRLKDSGLERFPFTNLAANHAWLALVCLAADLVRWFQLLCLTGPLATARPKHLRWAFWHIPGRITTTGRTRTIRVPATWTVLDDLIAAHAHIANLN